jgi:hypothetical protein
MEENVACLSAVWQKPGLSQHAAFYPELAFDPWSDVYQLLDFRMAGLRRWQALNARHGRAEGRATDDRVAGLGAARQGWERLQAAVEEAVALGTRDAAAIRHLLDSEGLEKPAVAEIEIGTLVRYDRPEPVMTGYDQLLRKV